MSRRIFALLILVPAFVAGSFFLYHRSRTVDWEGNIIGILAGGEGLAVRRIDTGQEFQAYLPAGTVASVSEGLVRIRGRLTGTSCAYANTVFSGTCTPTVDVETLTSQ